MTLTLQSVHMLHIQLGLNISIVRYIISHSGLVHNAAVILEYFCTYYFQQLVHLLQQSLLNETH